MQSIFGASAARDDACMHMIAIVGKKEEDIERQYNSLLKCIGMREHTAENLDKWIQVATIDSQYYVYCF